MFSFREIKYLSNLIVLKSVFIINNNYCVSNQGIFIAWNEPGFFDKVYINTETNAISWSEDIELCPDSLYLKLKNLSFEEWEKSELVNASN
ncbi:MAG: DUF2442 domain-containing protein [Bacteroidetes bacterium]|nr:MAG: DUF2442 domain-containing protein [Bacteroidota bacterium]